MRYVSLTKTGLTVLELLVVIGIMAVISTVVLTHYPEFGGSLSLGRVARETALSVRQAQAYGLGVRGIADPVKYPPYGIYFSQATPNEFILFADLNNNGDGNGYYDPGNGCGSADTECVEEYDYSSKEYIAELCTINADSGENPDSSDCNQTVDDLSITFKRPEPEAYIRSRAYPATLFNGALVRLVSRKYPAKQQLIRVWITGQISVLGQ